MFTLQIIILQEKKIQCVWTMKIRILSHNIKLINDIKYKKKLSSRAIAFHKVVKNIL